MDEPQLPITRPAYTRAIIPSAHGRLVDNEHSVGTYSTRRRFVILYYILPFHNVNPYRYAICIVYNIIHASPVVLTAKVSHRGDIYTERYLP